MEGTRLPAAKLRADIVRARLFLSVEGICGLGLLCRLPENPQDESELKLPFRDSDVAAELDNSGAAAAAAAAAAASETLIAAAVVLAAAISSIRCRIL